MFPQFPCPADIVPIRAGDLAVDVDDLLAVITNWGPCLPNDGGIAGGGGPPPTIMDCLEKCTEAYPAGGVEFVECMQKCLDAISG